MVDPSFFISTESAYDSCVVYIDIGKATNIHADIAAAKVNSLQQRNHNHMKYSHLVGTNSSRIFCITFHSIRLLVNA